MAEVVVTGVLSGSGGRGGQGVNDNLAGASMTFLWSNAQVFSG